MPASTRRELAIALELDEKGFVSGAAKAEAAAKGFEKELEAVEQAAREADAALAKVDSAQLPELTQKAGEAKFRMQELEAATQALVKAGGQIPAGVTQKVEQLSTKLDDAATRGQKFQLSMQETQRQAKGAAGVFEGTALAGGKLDGVLGGMTSQADKLTGVVGRLSGVIGAVVATFTAAYAAGTKLRENWDKIGETLNKVQPGMKRLFDGLKSLGKEAVDFGAKAVTGVDDATGAYDRLGVKVESNIGKQTRLKNAIKEGTDEIRQAAPVFAAFQDAVKASTAEVKGMEAGLARIAKVQGADFSTWISENAEALLAWYEALDKTGRALADKSASISRAVEASKAYVAEQLRLSQSVGATNAQLSTQVLALGVAADATKDATLEMVRYGDALRGTAQAGAEATESIRARAQAEAERAAVENQAGLDRMKAEAAALDERAAEVDRQVEERNRRIDSMTGGGEGADRILALAAANQQWARAIVERNAAMRESDQILAAQIEAHRQLATVVDASTTSIYDSLPKIREYFAEFDEAAGQTFAAGWINNVVNAFKEGTLAGRDAAAMLGEIQDGMRRLVGMGALFLAEDLAKLDQIKTAFARTAEAIRQEKRRLKFEFPEDVEEQPAGEDRAAGVAGVRSQGSLGRVTAELTKTRTP